ncbi:hypothetical protein D3C76_743980 [compost metagenome]
MTELFLVLRRLAQQLDDLQAVQQCQCTAAQRLFIRLFNLRSTNACLQDFCGHDREDLNGGISDFDQFEMGTGGFFKSLGMIRQLALEMITKSQFARIFG